MCFNISPSKKYQACVFVHDTWVFGFVLEFFFFWTSLSLTVGRLIYIVAKRCSPVLDVFTSHLPPATEFPFRPRDDTLTHATPSLGGKREMLQILRRSYRPCSKAAKCLWIECLGGKTVLWGSSVRRSLFSKCFCLCGISCLSCRLCVLGFDLHPLWFH